MNTIPLISLKQGKLFTGITGEQLSVDELFSSVEKDTMLYVLDQDGILENKANFDTYQHLTEHCSLWIDNGPRRLDDIMDTIMAGATNLTLRKNIWPDVDIPGILDLTEDELFFALTLDDLKTSQDVSFVYSGIGLVIFNEDQQTDFTSVSHLKDLALKHPIYLYNPSSQPDPTWEQRGITGILRDVQKKQGGTPDGV
jgi:hypothetical protein